MSRDLLTVAQVAEALGVTGQFVRNQIKSGQIPSISIGRSVRVKADVVAELVDKQSASSEVAGALPGRLAFSPEEAADMFGVSRQTIYNMVRRGEIRSFTMGRSRKIPATEVARLMEGGE